MNGASLLLCTLAVVELAFSLHWYLAIILFPGNFISSAQRLELAPRRSGPHDKSDGTTTSSRSPGFVPETPTFGSPATSNAVFPPESDFSPESADEMDRPKRRRRWSMNIDDKFVDIPIQSAENGESVEENGTPRAPILAINGNAAERADSVMQDAEDFQSLDPMNQ
jgi:hypothetical protein